MAPGPRPSPLLGEDRPEPGYWAQLAIDGPWIADRAMSQYQGRLLALLRERKPLREPGTRVGKQKVDGEYFYDFIGAKLTNMQALVAQAVGDVNKHECKSCMDGHGPFTSCISVPSIASNVVLRTMMPCCANCHFKLKARAPPTVQQTLNELRQSNDVIMQSLREARYARENAQGQYEDALSRLLAADTRMGEVLAELEGLWIGLDESDPDSDSDSEY